MNKKGGKPNALPRTSASSKLGKGRRKDKDPGSARSAETIKRLKMYNNGKAIRNRDGRVVSGQLQMGTRAGDKEITAATGRVQPDRRWFGNTRTVTSTQLDKFREEMTSAVSDPYSVVLKRKKLPMGLLQDVAEYQKNKTSSKFALLQQEPFEHAFGKQSRRKRVKLNTLLVERTVESVQKKKASDRVQLSSGGAEQIDQPTDDNEDDNTGYQLLLRTAQTSQQTYQSMNAAEGIVPWGRDQQSTQLDVNDGWRIEKKDDLFLKGQSKRIWNEFFKVIDCSDVVLHVIDARNVPGTRCTMIERHLQQPHASHKHLVFILNKIDLVPNWVAKRWIGELAAIRPTIAFHASITHAFGKGALISLLRQFGKLHQDKKQISVGVIGYPNVGKSSVINTLISKKSCKTAPIPGETKIWQYVTLFKRISLIDCPGVVVDTAGDTEEDSVLKGVVRAERLEHPEDFVPAIQKRVKREHIAAQYKIPVDGWPDVDDGDNTNERNSSIVLMELIARKGGRLRKGGDPCLRTAAITLINDFQRGRLPHYVPPPELKVQPETMKHEVHVDQNLDTVGEEHMADEKEDIESVGESDIDATMTQNDGKVENLATKVDMQQHTQTNYDQAVPTSTSLIGLGNWDD